MSDVDVSIAIPCYNTEDFLDQALSSAEQNDRCSLEIIVINDGSTDGSLSIMREHAARDPRVRVIDKPNQGYGATVNRGFSEAKGEFLAILEPDDWVEPHMYDDLIDYAHTFDCKPDIVKSSYWRIVNSGTSDEHRLHCSYYDRIRPKDQPFTLVDEPRLIQHHPSIWSALYRRGFLDECGIRFKECPGAGWVDNPFLIETMCQAKRIVYRDRPYYCYREDLPGSSSSARVVSLSFERWNDMADVMERLGVTNLGIQRSLCIIGFRYVSFALGHGARDDEKAMADIAGIFSRMDPAAIAACTNVDPSLRRMAYEVSGRPVPTIDRGPYLKALADEFIYGCRVNGAGFAISRMGVFFDRKSAEHGTGSFS